MKGKNYKIVSLYSFFPFQENLILDLKNKLLEIENENDLSGLLIFAREGINGTICAEKNIIKIVIDTINFFPILPGLLELLGVVVVGQWSWQNLRTSENREAVIDKVQNLKKTYLG